MLPRCVLEPLEHYRVAISNAWHTFVGDGQVRFEYVDYAHQHTRKELPLAADEFLRRFLPPPTPFPTPFSSQSSLLPTTALR